MHLCKMRLTGILSAIAVLLLGCSAHKEMVSSGDSKLAKFIKSVDGLDEHHWGLALYDPDAEVWEYQRDADKYFTPGSATKILTLAASLEYLPDTLPAFQYKLLNHTLYFSGTGYPYLFWGPDTVSTSLMRVLLGDFAGEVVYCPGREVARYGPGWAWDDYPYNFQVERSMLPLFGNRVRLGWQRDSIDAEPSYFKSFSAIDHSAPPGFSRLPESNLYLFNPTGSEKSAKVERTMPFMTSDYDATQILAAELNRSIGLDYNITPDEDWILVYGMERDSLLKQMMQQSDNFVSEQLLLMVGLECCQVTEYDPVIAYLKDTMFNTSTNEMLWTDGSGLSRYNLFTPASLVRLLDELWEERGVDYIKEIFPAGGVSGTIEDWYSNGDAQPYIYAKTGTLRNNHSLSGFLLTRSNRWLIFSFMHNNYSGSSSTVKPDMERVLEQIRDMY